MMPTKLRNLRVQRVDLVDAGASQDASGTVGAHVVLFKRIEKAETKTEGGVDFPAAAYAYVPDPATPSGWKLRLWEDLDLKETARQVGMAMAALGPGGFRGNRVQIPTADLAGVKRRVLAAWRKVHPDAATADEPAMLKKGDGTMEESAIARVLSIIAAKLGISKADLAKDNLEDLPQRVRSAFQAQFGGMGGYGMAYVTEVDDAFVIACIGDSRGSKMYQIPWVEDAEGDITFDTLSRVEVMQEWIAKATSFADALMQRQMGDMTEELGQAIGAFYEATQSALADPEVKDKSAAVKAALSAFGDAVKACVADWMVAKIGRKISATRLKRLRDVQAHIAAILAEAEAVKQAPGAPAPTDNTNEGGTDMDEKVLAGLSAEIQKAWTDMKATIAKLTADLKTAVGLKDAATAEAEAAKAELIKAQPAKLDDIWKGVHPEVRKAHEDAVKRAEAAETLAKSERDERLKGVYIAKAGAFRGLPVKADDDWVVLKALDEKMDPAHAARIMVLLKAADEALVTAKAFTEIGRGGVPEAGSAEDKINKLAEDLVVKSATPLTIEQARVRVMELRPELYAEHVRETRGEG